MAKSKEDRKKGAPEEGKAKKSKGDSKQLSQRGGVEEKVPNRLKEFYRSKIVKELMEKFGYTNVNQVPKLEKICINVGVGSAVREKNPKFIEATVNEIEKITGQRPAITKAKKSVSNFQLREGMDIGVRVTLRNARMFEFLDRFINIATPRIRDFRGLPDKSFDGRGNYTLGIKEQIIFPEINVDQVTRISGMDITFVTSAKSDQESYELLKQFGFPFLNRQAKQ